MKQLITILLCLFTLFAEAQVNTNDTNKYFKSYDYGFSYKRLQAREAFIMPTDTVINKLGAVSLNGNIYLGNGIKWTSIGGGSSIDTTSLSNRINKKIDSLKRSSDSVFARKNGVFVFQYKDSVGTTIDTTNQFVKRLDRTPGKDSIIYFVGANRFAIKDSVGSNGSVTSVAALSLGTSGSDLSSTVVNGTTTPVITLNVPDASTSARGVVTTASQTFGGSKTFRDNIFIQKTSSTSQNITIGFGGGVADYDNLAFGSLALNSSTANAYANLGVGHYSLQKITNGTSNVGLGNYTLYSLINGQNNTAIGYNSLGKSTGSENTVLGSNAGSELVSGNNNILIGASVINSTTSGSNNTIIGKITGLGGSLSNNVIISDGSGNIRFKDDNTNTTLPRLAGTGTRMVTAGANGELNTQAIPTGASIAVDTIFRTTGKDSIFYKKNSITYAIKDSVGTNIDTTNQFVKRLTRTPGKDSIIYFVGANRFAIKDSVGNTSGFVPYTGAISNVDLGTKNITSNAYFNGFTSMFAKNDTIILSIDSTPVHLVKGSGGQAYKLPVATTLPNGTIFSFNNNQSSGVINVISNSIANTLVKSVPSGAYCTLELTDNTTSTGTWDAHFLTPSNVSWSTNTLDYAGSITNATWNGNVVAYNRGGTGQSSTFTQGGIMYGSSTSALASTAAGTSGQMLISNGTSAPTWADTSVFQRKSISSYTILANNTASTANVTAQQFRDTSGVYSGTITWTGTTAPSGATTHTYRLTQVGKCVTLHIALVYATNGAALTAVQMTLPSGAPTPVQPTGLTGALTNMYPLNAIFVNTGNSVLSLSSRGFLRNNTAGNGFELYVTFISGAPSQANITLQYWTN